MIWPYFYATRRAKLDAGMTSLKLRQIRSQLKLPIRHGGSPPNKRHPRNKAQRSELA